MSPRGIGILQIVLSGIGFGLLGIAGKETFALGITAGEHLALRFLGASTFLFAYLAVFDRRALRLPPKVAVKCVALGTCVYAVFSMCYFTALSGLSVSLTVLLLYTYPVIVAILARIFLRQALPRHGLVALVAVSIGLVLLVGTEVTAKDATFVAYGLGSAFLYSFYILISSRVLRGASKVASVAAIQLAAGVALAVLNFHDLHRVRDILQSAWWLIAATALFATAGPMVLFISGLMRLTAAEVSMLSTVEPLTGVLIAMLCLGERMAPAQFGGAFLLVGALFVLTGLTPRKFFRRGANAALVFVFLSVSVLTNPCTAQAKIVAKKPMKTHRRDLLAPAGKASEGGNRVGVYTAISYEAMDYQPKPEDPRGNLDGLGFEAGGLFTAGFWRYFGVDLMGGLHYAYLHGDSDVANLHVTFFSLSASAAPFLRWEKFEAGIPVGYDYGLGGTASLTTAAGSSSRALAQSSRRKYGARFFFHLSDDFSAGFDAGPTSGSYRLKPGDGDVAAPANIDFTGFFLRILLRCRF